MTGRRGRRSDGERLLVKEAGTKVNERRFRTGTRGEGGTVT